MGADLGKAQEQKWLGTVCRESGAVSTYAPAPVSPGLAWSPPEIGAYDDWDCNGNGWLEGQNPEP